MRNWLGELFCSVCLQAFTEAEDRANLALLNDVVTVLASADGHLFEFNTLAQFEHSPVMRNPANYSWYQAQLQIAALRITAAAGARAGIVGKLYDFLQRHQDPHEFPTDAALAAALS
ncbi:hypothetical protein [Hymenobacter volaticus]|uniref:Uncharacterized protein n=1 Tax=Hymenobacter volaticus TaxID=2932254 RepID=A0ABY4GDL9_9BACT|nr:hypothetical protein [Hymenobacter volaticus]UOQ69006.1 hypothetical protein MUN86_26235 [Hymenobacter volaticus]